MTAPPLNSPKPSQLTIRQRVLIPVAMVAFAAIAISFWYSRARPIAQTLQLSGRIEGYETDLGARIGGRIDQVTVREGDSVDKGQLLVRIHDDDVQAQLRGAVARVTAAQQQEQQARLQLDVIDSQIQEAQLTVAQSQQDNQGRVFQSQSNLATAEAHLKQAQAQLNLATVNRDRYAQLYREGAGKKIEFDQAQTTYESAQANLEAARKQIDAAKGGLEIAQTSTYNPVIRTAQLSALQQQRKRAYAQLQVAQAEVKSAQATQQQIQAQLNYLTITSPITGVVLSRNIEPGVVVASGAKLLTVIDPNSVYLRGFVPEGDIGKIRVGQQAKVYLDSAPKQPLSARVAAIDTQASFTPENIYFRDDRVRQAFGVKLAITNPSGYAKPGMPADGEIVLESQ